MLRQNIRDNASFPDPFRYLTNGYIRKAFHENGRLFCVILMIQSLNADFSTGKCLASSIGIAHP